MFYYFDMINWELYFSDKMYSCAVSQYVESLNA